MTDATINTPTITATAEMIVPGVTARVKTVNLDFETMDGATLGNIQFESVYPGIATEVQEFMVTNGGTGSVNIVLQTVASSTNPQGSEIDTIDSTYFSSDNVTFSKTLELTISSQSSTNFYIKYQPPSTAKVGVKEWKLNPVINELAGGSAPGYSTHLDWSYYDTFTITGTAAEDMGYPVALTIPYTSGDMNEDFSDVRFVDSDGNELGYYITDKTDADHADFLIQAPIPANGVTTTIYVYVGNPGAESQSDSNNIDGMADKWVLDDPNGIQTAMGGTNDPSNQWDFGDVDNGSMDYIEQKITLVNLNTITHGGTATNINPINSNFTFKATVFAHLTDFWLFFYMADTDNLILAGFRHRASFQWYWEIGKIVNGVYSVITNTWNDPGESPFNNEVFEVDVVKNTSITIKRGGTTKLTYTGTFPQSGSTWGIKGENYNWGYGSGGSGGIYATKPIYSTSSNFTEPTVTALTGTWKFLSKELEIFGGILYQTQDLPELEPEITYAIKVGGTLYE